jgi:hypothetical protein
MPSDRSLDEFVETDGESDDTGDGSEATNTGDSSEATDTGDGSEATDTEPNDSDTAPPSDVDGDVEPVTPTAAWTAEYTCGRCGKPTQRSWYEDGTLVCSECKTW